MYPADIYEPRTKENKPGVEYDPDKTKVIFAEDVKNLDDNVVAIQETLGLNPQGVFSNVAERLDHVAPPGRFTYKRSVVCSTSDWFFIKFRIFFAKSSSFVRVYANDVLMSYGTDWLFNEGGDGFPGRLASLTDGVKILEGVIGVTYRVEVDEFYLPMTPILMRGRSDFGKMSQGVISQERYFDLVPKKIVSISEIDHFTINAIYEGSKSVIFRYPNLIYLAGFGYNDLLPNNWQIEVYRRGAAKNNVRIPNPKVSTDALIPIFGSSYNQIRFEDLFYVGAFRRFRNRFLVRLRQVSTNTVSNFSVQEIFARMYTLYNMTTNVKIGVYFRTGLR